MFDFKSIGFSEVLGILICGAILALVGLKIVGPEIGTGAVVTIYGIVVGSRRIKDGQQLRIQSGQTTVETTGAPTPPTPPAQP